MAVKRVLLEKVKLLDLLAGFLIPCLIDYTYIHAYHERHYVCIGVAEIKMGFVMLFSQGSV